MTVTEVSLNCKKKMAFLSSDNQDIAQPMELSLFASPTNQVAVEKVYFTEARPISSIGVSDTPIDQHNFRQRFKSIYGTENSINES